MTNSDATPEKPGLLHRGWLAVERYFLFNAIRLTRLRARSEAVARGFALGIIVNFFPTFGFGVVISGFFARIFGGNTIAGLVGGATLTFVWPVLFILNMRMGGLLLGEEPPDHVLGTVTDETIRVLDWGSIFWTFSLGACINSLIVGLTCYIILRAIYAKIRPSALAYFRSHARQHQLKFRRPWRQQLTPQ